MVVKIGFQGVSDASPFAIEVTQRGITADGSTERWGGATVGVSAQILVRRSNLKVAPEAMMFSVVLDGFSTEEPTDPHAYNSQLHDVYYFWDFGDPNSRFTAPQKVMNHQRDASVGYGPIVAHTFGVGEFTVRVTVIEPASGKVAVATLDLRGTEAVQSPNTVFGGDTTIFVDPTADGVPPDNALTATTITEALDLASGRLSAIRILLRAGATFELPSYEFGASMPSLYLAGETSGAQPIINWVPGGNTNNGHYRFNRYDPNNNKEIFFANFQTNGTWDETTETGTNMVGIAQNEAQGSYFLMHDCVFNGYEIAIAQNRYANDQGINFFSDSIISNWRAFGVYEENNSPSAYIGMRIARSSDALAGGPRNGSHNDHGPIRLQSCTKTIMDGCDFFNNSGWFENLRGIRTQQACVRWNQRGTRGSIGNIQRCTMEGGWPQFAVTRINLTDGHANVQNLLIDRNYFIGSWQTNRAIEIQYGGVTLRNNIWVMPDIPDRLTGTYFPGSFITCTPGITGGAESNFEENRNGPVRVYNNTFVYLQTATNGLPIFEFYPGGYDSTTQFQDFVAENNVLHVPNFSPTADIDQGPLDTTPLGITPRNNGYRSVYERVEFTIAAEVPIGGTVTIAYPSGRGQADYDATNGEPHDFYDGATTSVGQRENTNTGADFTFGATEIIVTNNTSGVFAAGDAMVVLFCPDSPHSNLKEYASPPNTIATYAPLIDSVALGAAQEYHDPNNPFANDLIAVGDFYGNLRPQVASRGAFEIGT